MAVMLRNEFTDFFFELLPYLRMKFQEEYGEPDGMLEGIFNVETSDRMREQTTGVSGFSYAVERPENEPVSYDELQQAFDKTYTHLEYALGYQVSKRARRDDRFAIFTTATRALARSMRTTKFTTVWDVFNNGFGSETTPDGVAVFSASHTLLEGGTFSNLVSADFSISSLQTGTSIFDDMRDHRNLPIELGPAVLCYKPTLRWIVAEILGSPQRPDTANRAVNVVEGLLRPHSVRYLTGDDDWFIGSEPGNHALMLFNRQEMETDQDMDFDTDAAKFKATQIHSQGFSDWRGWVGGQGQ